MAVVIDQAFFDSLGRMDPVEDVSNADIAWFVVNFVENGSSAEIVRVKVHYTTLERAVEGLTAGVPVTLGQFESEINRRLSKFMR